MGVFECNIIMVERYPSSVAFTLLLPAWTAQLYIFLFYALCTLRCETVLLQKVLAGAKVLWDVLACVHSSHFVLGLLNCLKEVSTPKWGRLCVQKLLGRASNFKKKKKGG